MVEAMSHVSITMTSLDKSIAFYTDVVGMQLVELKSSSPIYQEGGDNSDVGSGRVAYLSLPATTWSPSRYILRLVEDVSAVKRREGGDVNDSNIRLAFTVEDIFASYDAWQRHGVHFLSAPATIDEGYNKGGYVAFARDPNGIILELIQPSLRRLVG